MGAEQASCGFAIARLERGKDAGVLVDRIAPAPVGAEREVTRALGAGDQRHVRLAQRRVARHADDGVVDLAVDGEVLVELAVAMMAFHAGLKRAKSGEVAVGGALRGEFGGKALDAGQRLEQFRDAVDRNIGNPRAAVWAQLDQSFGREYLHRLAQRGARYAELFRQPGFL